MEYNTEAGGDFHHLPQVIKNKNPNTQQLIRI